MGTATLTAPEQQTDTFPINGTDYIEFYVGNAKQAAHFYQGAFGFQLVAYRGPETGPRDRASYLVVQNKIRLVLTSSLGADGEIAEHVQFVPGDGVGLGPVAIKHVENRFVVFLLVLVLIIHA